MKPIFSGFLLLSLAACGGGSGGADNIVSSGGALNGIASDVPDLDISAGEETPEETEVDLSEIPVDDELEVIVDPSLDASFGTLLNSVRIENGAGVVTFDSRLNAAAQRHADDMLENQYFSHTDLDGGGVGQRVAAEGYNFRRVGENIAAGYQTEESVLDGWVNSPGHQANNIDPRYEEFGLGYAVDGRDTRWVLVLGTEQ